MICSLFADKVESVKEINITKIPDTILAGNILIFLEFLNRITNPEKRKTFDKFFQIKTKLKLKSRF